MMPRISPRYLDSLFAAHDYDGLVHISSFLTGTEIFQAQRDDYNLPRPLFLIVESLSWFAQSMRSGVWTYFEATAEPRKQAMWSALVVEAPDGFPQAYAKGISEWKDQAEMDRLDSWMADQDDENNRWLWTLAATNRPLIDTLLS